MRERSPGVWELIVEGGRDPVTGKRRQVSRVFRGNLRDAKKARAELLVEVGKGRHTGTGATRRRPLRGVDRRAAPQGPVAEHDQGLRVGVPAQHPGVASASTPVRKVTTKMLTDLYGAHQKRGLSPRSVYQIHACLSSMFTQACKWGWRDTQPGAVGRPAVQTEHDAGRADARRRHDARRRRRGSSRRPEYARAIFITATTGVRRAELCALRRRRDIDWDRGVMTVTWSIFDRSGEPPREIPTKNRRARPVALDEATLRDPARAGRLHGAARRRSCGVELVDDAYLFSDAARRRPCRGSPARSTRYFDRLRKRVGLDRTSTSTTCASSWRPTARTSASRAVQVALRAGHDPSVAARHYTGSVADDRPGAGQAPWRSLLTEQRCDGGRRAPRSVVEDVDGRGLRGSERHRSLRAVHRRAERCSSSPRSMRPSSVSSPSEGWSLARHGVVEGARRRASRVPDPPRRRRDHTDVRR